MGKLPLNMAAVAPRVAMMLTCGGLPSNLLTAAQTWSVKAVHEKEKAGQDRVKKLGFQKAFHARAEGCHFEK